MGDDQFQFEFTGHYSIISIHVPRMGDDVDILLNLITGIIFLSTSPVWGTTSVLKEVPRWTKNFYPRPPYGGRRDASWLNC